MTTAVTQSLPAVIERPPVEVLSYDETERLAVRAAKSGLFNGQGSIMNADQAFTLMMIAQADGIHPMKAMLKYHVIQGRPSMKADALLAEFQRIGGRHEWEISDAQEAKCYFWHPVLHPTRFPVHRTFDWFVEKGIALGRYDERTKKRSLKDNWANYPAQMIRARIISEGVTAIAPGIKVGIMPEEDADEVEPQAIDSPRSKLLEALEAKKAATFIEAKPADPPFETKNTPDEPPKPDVPKKPKAEWVAWLEEQLDGFNPELKQADPDAKPVTIHQVVNAIVTEGLRIGDIKDAQVLGPSGKRSTEMMGATMATFWSVEPSFIQDNVGKYFSQKLDAAMTAKPATSKQGSLLNEDESSLADES